MSGARMPTRPASASEGFSSTPIKTTDVGKPSGENFKDDILASDDDDTFSLLSPIYHDSFDSDEEDEQESASSFRGTSARTSPVRCELPRTQMLGAALQPPASPTHGAWEVWLVNKAKEDRVRLELRAEEERLLKEEEERRERERREKSIFVEEKIHGWLKMKREKERNEQLQKQNRELEETRRRQEEQREIQQKAERKYKDWLQKKKQEEKEKEKKEKEEAALKEAQEKERRRKAEEKFKEWLAKADERGGASPRSPSRLRSPYDTSHPSPSFYNPIPWKPIHVPPPETNTAEMAGKKPAKQRGGGAGKMVAAAAADVRLRNGARRRL